MSGVLYSVAIESPWISLAANEGQGIMEVILHWANALRFSFTHQVSGRRKTSREWTGAEQLIEEKLEIMVLNVTFYGSEVFFIYSKEFVCEFKCRPGLHANH